MVEANPQPKTINHTQLLSLTVAIAAISCAWLTQASHHDHHSTAHHHHHARHLHSHWDLLDRGATPNWPPGCEGDLVDEGITHAHALLNASREVVRQNPGLREWITQDANMYDPDQVHVNSRAELEAAGLTIYESHFFTCYSLLYDEDGDQIGYDRSKTFSYEYELPATSWQISGNSREEINSYLREHGFNVEEEEEHKEHRHQVASDKTQASLIGTLVKNREKKKEKPKMQQRAPTRSTLEFDVEDETFAKTKD